MKSRLCYECREYVPESGFSASAWKNGNFCRKCRTNYDTASYNQHVLWLNERKSAPCMDCGVSYPPYVMDFDHRDGNEKDRAISRLVSNNSGWNRLKAEVEKCDLVCANCHRIRTHWRLTNPVMTCTLLA